MKAFSQQAFDRATGSSKSQTVTNTMGIGSPIRKQDVGSKLSLMIIPTKESLVRTSTKASECRESS